MISTFGLSVANLLDAPRGALGEKIG